MSYQQVDLIQKKQFCENIYEQNIVKAYENLKTFIKFSEVLSLTLPISCYTNFRDSLFHFRRIVMAIDEVEMETQAFAVKEHLSRALTDASISILDYLFLISEKLLKSNDVETEKKEKIRNMMHTMKKYSLMKRLNGMMLSTDSVFHVDIETVLEKMQELYDYLDNSCHDELKEILNSNSGSTT